MELELLTTAILTHWKQPFFNAKEIKLDPRWIHYGKSELGFEYLY